jgi:hypothetical protein
MHVSSLTDLILQGSVKQIEEQWKNSSLYEGIDANYQDMISAVFCLNF